MPEGPRWVHLVKVTSPRWVTLGQVPDSSEQFLIQKPGVNNGKVPFRTLALDSSSLFPALMRVSVDDVFWHSGKVGSTWDVSPQLEFPEDVSRKLSWELGISSYYLLAFPREKMGKCPLPYDHGALSSVKIRQIRMGEGPCMCVCVCARTRTHAYPWCMLA